MENKTHELTIAEVRATGVFDHLKDEEIQCIINTLKELSLILMNMSMKHTG